MPSRFLIYALTDPLGAIRYIGKSSSGMKRPRSHGWPSALRHKMRVVNWIKSLRARGADYSVLVLEHCSDHDALCAAEIRWIAHGRAAGWRLTNVSDGGRAGGAGCVPSTEARAKMRAAQIARFSDPAERERLSESMRSRVPTAGARAKISATLKGHAVSQETRDKIAKTLRDRDEHRAPRPSGWHHTDDTRARIGAASKGRSISDDHRAKIIAAKNDPAHRSKVSANSAAVHAGRTPEQRSEIARKAWDTRRTQKAVGGG